jgi:polysaccharide export outer membrane protein
MKRFAIPLFVVLGAVAYAQTRVAPSAPATQPSPGTIQGGSSSSTSATSVAAPTDYILGGGDQLQVDVPALADEFTTDKNFRIDGGGDLGLPIIGHVQAAGLTVAKLEEVIKDRLKRVVQAPDVIVTVTGFGSQPVSVLGSVTTPGIVQIGGQKDLFQVLSLAGGLAPDAGYQITITRDLKWGALPLSDAHLDATGQYSIGSVKITNLLNFSNTTDNIMILPNDKIAVPTSDRVYAVGNLTKPGGFLLNQHESISALQVVSLAEGFSKSAAPQRAKILRVVPGSPNRMEIAVNLKALVQGKIPDIQLKPDDILFVPNSSLKSAGNTAITALTGAAGAIVYASKSGF